MTTTITATNPQRLQTGDADGRRCVVCDRVWPGEPTPLMHRWVLSATEPKAERACASTHAEATWHQFQVINSRGVVVADGMVCPPCAVDPGVDVALGIAMMRAIAADRNAN